MRQDDKPIRECEERRAGGKEKDKCGGAVNSASRPTANKNSHSVCWTMCDSARPRVQHLFRESANTSITHKAITRLCVALRWWTYT